MPTIREVRLREERDDDIILSETEIREYIKFHEDKIRLLREALQIVKKAVRVKRLLDERGPMRKNPSPVILEKQGPVRPLRDEIRALKQQLPSRFTTLDVLQKLQKYPFNRDPKSAVRDAIYELTNNEELRIVKPGKGGKPNILEWPQQARAVAS